jgi:hypothetical protein
VSAAVSLCVSNSLSAPSSSWSRSRAPRLQISAVMFVSLGTAPRNPDPKLIGAFFSPRCRQYTRRHGWLRSGLLGFPWFSAGSFLALGHRRLPSRLRIRMCKCKTEQRVPRMLAGRPGLKNPMSSWVSSRTVGRPAIRRRPGRADPEPPAGSPDGFVDTSVEIAATDLGAVGEQRRRRGRRADAMPLNRPAMNARTAGPWR